MRRRPKERIGRVAGVVIAAGLLVVTVLLGKGASTVSSGAASHDKPPARARSANGVRTFEDQAGGVRWTMTRSSSAQGGCVEVVAEQVGGTEWVNLGCASDDPLLGLGIGGALIADQWYNVAYGEVPPAASSVRVTLGDGSVVTDSNVSLNQGLWIVVAPGSPNDPAIDFTRIEAIDGSGGVIAQVDPPSLAAYAQLAQAQASATSAARAGSG